jgi:hypothetical protein
MARLIKERKRDALVSDGSLHVGPVVDWQPKPGSPGMLHGTTCHAICISDRPIGDRRGEYRIELTRQEAIRVIAGLAASLERETA